MKKKNQDLPIHLALIAIAALTLLPFFFVLNNSLRRTSEQYHSYFGAPSALTNIFRFTWFRITGQRDRIRLRVTPEEKQATSIRAADVPFTKLPYPDAIRRCGNDLTHGFVWAWQEF